MGLLESAAQPAAAGRGAPPLPRRGTRDATPRSVGDRRAARALRRPAAVPVLALAVASGLSACAKSQESRIRDAIAAKFPDGPRR